MQYPVKFLLVISVAVCLFWPAALPQASTGTVHETVLDSSHAVIPGALVTLTNIATNVNFHNTANTAGTFVVPGVIPGACRLTAESPGMDKFEATLTVQVQQTAVIDPVLKVDQTVSFAFAAAAAGKGLSPLSITRNRRFLQDSSGHPFFLVGDCPQNMPLKLAIRELDRYMLDCEQKGFNLLWICIDGQRSGKARPQDPTPRDRQGNLMMTSGWDIGTLNPAYFSTIDAIAAAADRHGIYCMFTPLSECQWAQDNINANSADKWRRYGAFLGKRYRNTANIVWQFGNDHINTTAQHAIVEGIKEAGDTHLMTVNWRPGYRREGSGWERKYKFGEDWIDLNAWYINAPADKGGAPCYWQKIEYQRPNPMPSFLAEAHYQKPYAVATDLEIRMQNYYVALGGGCGGVVYGSGYLADDFDYASYRNNGGRVQTIHFKTLFTSRDWTSLTPDYGHTFITGGYGTRSPTTMDYVGAASNGASLGMAYCPKAATITVNMATFRAKVTARWYDPTNGTMRNIEGSPFANTGPRDFSTPGSNHAGERDWVLLLEAKAKVQ